LPAAHLAWYRTDLKTMYLRDFSVLGYRSFANEVMLTELRSTVVLYGLNNAGKTNLLRAVALFHRLMRMPLERLLEDHPRSPEAVYKELDEDAWMFNLDGGDQIELCGTIRTETGARRLRFAITRTDEGIRYNLMPPASVNSPADPASGTDTAIDRSAEVYRSWQHALETEVDEDSAVLKRTQQDWESVKASWDELVGLVDPGMAVTASAGRTSSMKLRTAMARLGKSLDRRRRRRSGWALEQFGRLASGLAPGKMEPVEHQDGGDDFGWVSESGVLPLDQLGSGAQALFAVLATMALAETPAVALEEPESHLNALLQQQLCASLAEAMCETTEVCQLFIATHSPSFANAAFDLRLVERKDQHTSLREIQPADLGPYIPVVEGGGDDNTPSLLGFDGSIQLPEFVRDGLGIAPGQFVYFVPAGNQQFRLVTEAEMAAGLGEV
jgi:hypothetical protein